MMGPLAKLMPRPVLLGAGGVVFAASTLLVIKLLGLSLLIGLLGVLIQRSGLHFPLTDSARNPRSVRGVGGTRSLEWWLSEEAVILDMPGRLLKNSEFQDTEDWVAFLETLRSQRRDKPLNGVVVA